MQILTNCGSLGWPVVVWNSVSDKTDEKKNSEVIDFRKPSVQFRIYAWKRFTDSIHVKAVSMARKLYQKNLNFAKIN